MVKAYSLAFIKDYVLGIFWTYWAASILKEGRSLSEAAVFIGLFFLFCALCEFPSGVFADRFGRKKATLIGLITLMMGFFLKSFSVFPWVAFPVTAIGLTFMNGAFLAWLTSFAENQNMKSSRFLFNVQINGRLAMIASGFLGNVIFDLGTRALWLSIVGILGIALFIAFFIPESKEVSHNESLTQILTDVRGALRNPAISLLFLATAFFGIENGGRNLIANPYILQLQENDHYFLGYFNAALAVIRLAGLLSYRYWIGPKLKDARRAYYFLIFGLCVFAGAEMNGSFAATFAEYAIPYIIAIFVFGWYFALRDIILIDLIEAKTRASLLSMSSMMEEGMAAICCFSVSFFITERTLPSYWMLCGGALLLASAAYFLSWVKLGVWEKRSVAPG